VKCEMCDMEFNNSEELKRHQEQAHPKDEGQADDADRENPEIKREMPGSDPVDMPTPAERTR
jgi:hypothetical protein